MAYLDHIRSDHSMLQLFTKPGARVPLYCTGVGKMLLSRWPSSQVEAYLDRTPLTPTRLTPLRTAASFSMNSHASAPRAILWTTRKWRKGSGVWPP